MTTHTAPFRLEDDPPIACVDLPADPVDRLRYAWRLTNEAWDELERDLTYDPRRGVCMALTRDGFHTLLLHCLTQAEDDGIEAIMADVAQQRPR